MANETPKPAKDRIISYIDVASKLLIPITIFIVGQYFTMKQEKADDKRYTLDQYTKLITPLSSTNPAERKIATVLVSALATPTDSIAAHILLAMAGDSNGEVAQTAKSAFVQKVAASPRDAQSIINATKSDTTQTDLLSRVSREIPALDSALKRADPKWRPKFFISNVRNQAPPPPANTKDCVDLSHPLISRPR